MSILSLIISIASFIFSIFTLWLTYFHRGRLKMTRPSVIFFGREGTQNQILKVYLRTLLFSTGRRGFIVENMFLKLKTQEETHFFNIWTYGESELARGSGLSIDERGVICNHHFLLQKNIESFPLLSGPYTVEIFATIVGKKPKKLNRIELSISVEQANELKVLRNGIFFDWIPEQNKYNSHVREKKEDSNELLETLISLEQYKRFVGPLNI